MTPPPFHPLSVLKQWPGHGSRSLSLDDHSKPLECDSVPLPEVSLASFLSAPPTPPPPTKWLAFARSLVYQHQPDTHLESTGMPNFRVTDYERLSIQPPSRDGACPFVLCIVLSFAC